MTVFVYVNTSKQVGDPEYVKVFATTDAAEKWFEENDPEGVTVIQPVRNRNESNERRFSLGEAKQNPGRSFNEEDYVGLGLHLGARFPRRLRADHSAHWGRVEPRQCRTRRVGRRDEGRNGSHEQGHHRG